MKFGATKGDVTLEGGRIAQDKERGIKGKRNYRRT